MEPSTLDRPRLSLSTSKYCCMIPICWPSTNLAGDPPRRRLHGKRSLALGAKANPQCKPGSPVRASHYRHRSLRQNTAGRLKTGRGLEHTQNSNRAMLVNDSYLPVVVGRCNGVSDSERPHTTVGDVIQRWDIQHGDWLTVYRRRECSTGDAASAPFSYEMLWPGGRLYTSSCESRPRAPSVRPNPIPRVYTRR